MLSTQSAGSTLGAVLLSLGWSVANSSFMAVISSSCISVLRDAGVAGDSEGVAAHKINGPAKWSAIGTR